MVLYYNMWLISVILAAIIVFSSVHTAIRGHPLLRGATNNDEYQEAKERVIDKCAGIAILVVIFVIIMVVRICGGMFVHIEYDKDHIFYEYDSVDTNTFDVTVYPLLFPIHKADYFSFDTKVYTSPNISIKADGMMPKQVYLERYVQIEELDWKYRDRDYIVKSEGVEDGLLSCDVIYSNGFVNKTHSVHLVDIEYRDDGTAVLDLTLNGVPCEWIAEVLPEGEG